LSASPSCHPASGSPLAVNPSLRRAAIVALDCVAPAPSSQTIGSASSAVLARHQVLATTPTVESFHFHDARTPGPPRHLAFVIARQLAAEYRAGFHRGVQHCPAA